MHAHGLEGDVAVIGKDADYPSRGYLTVFDLKMLQNKWGWDIV